MKLKHFLMLCVALCITACQSDTTQVKGKAGKAKIIAFNNIQNEDWLIKLKSIEQGKSGIFRILQIGDSHTAGDYFTGMLRSNLQMRLGNGGMGWVAPAPVSGQRAAQVKYQGGWKTVSSRNSHGDFPLGGVYAYSNGTNAETLTPVQSTGEEQRITLAVKPTSDYSSLTVRDAHNEVTTFNDLDTNEWKYVQLDGFLPISYQANSGGSWHIGQIGAENKNGRGVTVSAMGINGSRFSQWSKWKSNLTEDLQATQADLVILAYGTNEAFDDNLDETEFMKAWGANIKRIKQALPNAGILIVGAPESLRSRKGDYCGHRPTKLSAVQTMQKRIAEQENIMYWSWQDAMGGECSMNIWIAKGLGAKDGVHFSAKGYQQAAANLATSLLQLTK